MTRISCCKVHRDSSLISVTIALNDRNEFEGGGMWVEPLDKVIGCWGLGVGGWVDLLDEVIGCIHES